MASVTKHAFEWCVGKAVWLLHNKLLLFQQTFVPFVGKVLYDLAVVVSIAAVVQPIHLIIIACLIPSFFLSRNRWFIIKLIIIIIVTCLSGQKTIKTSKRPLGAHYVHPRVKNWTQGSDDGRDSEQGFGRQQLFPVVTLCMMLYHFFVIVVVVSSVFFFRVTNWW